MQHSSKRFCIDVFVFEREIKGKLCTQMNVRPTRPEKQVLFATGYPTNWASRYRPCTFLVLLRSWFVWSHTYFLLKAKAVCGNKPCFLWGVSPRLQKGAWPREHCVRVTYLWVVRIPTATRQRPPDRLSWNFKLTLEAHLLIFLQPLAFYFFITSQLPCNKPLATNWVNISNRRLLIMVAL